jgi:hypothetical protein
MSELAESKDPIHIVVVQHGDDDESAIVGAQSIEWRRALVSGFLSLNVELAAVGGDAAVPTGVLSIQLEVLPRLDGGHGVPDESAIKAAIKTEKDKETEADRKFFGLAKVWWKDYLAIR